MQSLLDAHKCPKGATPTLVGMNGGKWTVGPHDGFFEALAAPHPPTFFVQRPGVDDGHLVVFYLDIDLVAAEPVDPEPFFALWRTPVLHASVVAWVGEAFENPDALRCHVATSSRPSEKRGRAACGIHYVFYMLIPHEAARALTDGLAAHLATAHPELDALLDGGFNAAVDRTSVGRRPGAASGLRMLYQHKYTKNPGGAPTVSTVFYMPTAVLNGRGELQPVETASVLRDRVLAFRCASLWPTADHPRPQYLRPLEPRKGVRRPRREDAAAPRDVRVPPLVSGIVAEVLRTFWTHHRLDGHPPTVIGMARLGESRFVVKVDGRQCARRVHRGNHAYFIVYPDRIVLRCHDDECKREGNECSMPLRPAAYLAIAHTAQ